MRTDKERFYQKVYKTGRCWIWIASKHRDGYGQFRFKGTMKLSHRVSYEMENGLIPDGMCICHTCDNPSCVNPDHLFIATTQENTADKMAKGRHRVPIGEAHGRAKLTEYEVIGMRAIREKYNVSIKQISDAMGYKYLTVAAAITGRTWKYLNEIRS